LLLLEFRPLGEGKSKLQGNVPNLNGKETPRQQRRALRRHP